MRLAASALNGALKNALKVGHQGQADKVVVTVGIPINGEKRVALASDTFRLTETGRT